MSSTVTLKEQLLEFPALSTVVSVTLFVPTGNALPDERPAVCKVALIAQLSHVAGPENDTCAEHKPGSAKKGCKLGHTKKKPLTSRG